MPNFKRIGGGPWKSPDDLTWNDLSSIRSTSTVIENHPDDRIVTLPFKTGKNYVVIGIFPNSPYKTDTFFL